MNDENLLIKAFKHIQGLDLKPITKSGKSLVEINADLQSRLTAAETRVKELEELVLRAIHFIDPHISPGRSAYNNNGMAIHLRAELDKLKGTK